MVEKELICGGEKQIIYYGKSHICWMCIVCEMQQAAQRLARSAGIATASDIMSMAQNRSGMTAEQWTEYVRISEEKISRIDRKAATIRVIGTFELSQRAIITWLLAVAITAFMAITPTGRHGRLHYIKPSQK